MHDRGIPDDLHCLLVGKTPLIDQRMDEAVDEQQRRLSVWIGLSGLRSVSMTTMLARRHDFSLVVQREL